MANEIAQGLFDVGSIQMHQLGAIYETPKGNKYRYAKAGAVALVTGHLLQEPAEDTNFRSMAVAIAAAIGDNEVTVTLGGTAVTSGLFAEGYLYVESSTGLGQKFNIVSHTVQTLTTGTVTFKLDRALKTALTTSSQVTVRKNPYNGVIDNPTTQTGGVVGVAITDLPVGYFGWIQSAGDVPMLFDTGTNTSAGATGVGPSAAVAGSVKPQSGAEGGIVIGYSREVVSTDSTYGLVHLMLD